MAMIRAALAFCLLLGPAVAHAQTSAPATEAALVAKGGKRLGAADFTARYIGNTLSGTTSDGDGFHVFVESPTAYRMHFQGKKTADRWSVGKDGEFCTIADGTETCTREYEHGGQIYSFNTDGTFAGSASLRPGNPEGL